MNTVPAARISVTVVARLAADVVVLNTGFDPQTVGESLAQQVDDYVRRERLSYYPALDFFRGRADAVDPALLTLLDELAGFGSGYAHHELRRRPRPAFAAVQVTQLSVQAYALPRARLRQPDRLAILARHYAPDTLRAELLLSLSRHGRDAAAVQAGLEAVERSMAAAFAAFSIVAGPLAADG